MTLSLDFTTQAAEDVIVTDLLAPLDVRANGWSGNVLLLDEVQGAPGYWTVLDIATGQPQTLSLTADSNPIQVLPTSGLFLVAELAAKLDETAKVAARERYAARQQLDVFKDEVRELAIQAHENGDFCKDGMNAAFRTLGLAEHETAFEVTVMVSVSATVTADDEDEAVQTLRDAISVDDSDEIDSYSVDINQHGDY